MYHVIIVSVRGTLKAGPGGTGPEALFKWWFVTLASAIGAECQPTDRRWQLPAGSAHLDSRGWGRVAVFRAFARFIVEANYG
jgi:hypothetical protein